MFITFAEYRISPEFQEQYEAATKLLLTETEGVELYEGTDQPGLFVEIWRAADVAQAERIKKERCSERSSWAVLTPMILGGSAKLHVWTFQPAHSPS
ncbi:hypothetical protein [Paenibacillus sp. PAMC21692]|uniref:hypothetical protein n=1 Tax=Paenibacillus sp. PAMC21692 TaxID=2762320 RepID=UPI00164EAE9F|nr:hypothetical protein [Paenibacillus sp. PAMC21692]QNK56198.1 hypothetical protein H7F31_27105 [Paenibacillus sp. PAMC21692]